jgi:hypothetical protein
MKTQASDWHQRSVTEGITTLWPAGMSCPRPDTQLTYMIDIVLTTEFAIAANSARRAEEIG